MEGSKMSQTDKIDDQINLLKRQITELENQKRVLDELTPAQRLAISLHDILCTWNHTDGCAWYYEMKNNVPTWKDAAQQNYLGMATKLLKKYKYGEIMDILQTIKDYK